MPELGCLYALARPPAPRTESGWGRAEPGGHRALGAFNWKGSQWRLAPSDWC